ncbi:MAG TPA: PLP-dependent aminotransferase family protein [Luteimonas sp.]|nr:PLP-dependent aminotransferase family protein [Luteimonas sp.]
MHVILDGQGPLHAQLTRALKQAMLAGRVAQGAQLPPTRLLAKELGLSRTTILTSYEQLRAEGYINGKVGSGSYVSPPLLVATTVQQGALTCHAQSDFSTRARLIHNHDALQRMRLDAVRFNFQYGLPLANQALSSAWARELAHAAMYTSPFYPATQGSPALRAAISDCLARRRGIRAEPDDILVVSGAQQAMALTASILIDPGDPVVVEEPQYFATREQLQIYGARITGVGVDAQGIRCDAMPPRPQKLICVTPSHQFPTGAVMSQSRRVDLLHYARQHQSWIFEDDYDGEFRYGSKPLPALQSLDQDGRVIYAGTFSKTMFPGLRMGYVVMPKALRNDFIAAKWVHDFGSPAIEQAALANFMAKGSFERHLRRMSIALHQRRQVLLSALRAIGGDRLTVMDSSAGMHLVVWLRDKNAAQGNAMIEHALSLGLGLHSVLPHYIDPPDRAGLLMGYGGLTTAEIRDGMEVFAVCLKRAYAS